MRRDERGSTVMEALFLIGFSLVAVMEMFNLGAWVIQKEIVHSAVDQGVRAGARADADSVGACEDRVRQTLGNLASGIGVAVSCSADSEQVSASAHLPLRAWLPGLPDSSVDVAAVARKEGLR